MYINVKRGKNTQNLRKLCTICLERSAVYFKSPTRVYIMYMYVHAVYVCEC